MRSAFMDLPPVISAAGRPSRDNKWICPRPQDKLVLELNWMRREEAWPVALQSNTNAC